MKPAPQFSGERPLEFLQETFTCRFDKEGLIELISNNPSFFEPTVQISLSNQQPQAWRATWIVGHCIAKNDPRLQPHLATYIDQIRDKEDGYQRELMKIMEKMECDEEHEGKLFDTCLGICEQVHRTPSVRIVAFRLITKTIKKYPELINEIEFLLENEYITDLTPGATHSFQILKEKLMKSIK